MNEITCPCCNGPMEPKESDDGRRWYTCPVCGVDLIRYEGA